MRILAIFAHPDDESYGPAGTLARATRNGHNVSLLTLTHGEAGSLSAQKYISAAEMAKCRGQELKNAARKLGIQHLRIHDLPDRYLRDIPDHIGTGLIRQEVKKNKPDIIITYHENTISGHPDHLAVSNWTLHTVRSISDPPGLFFYGLNKEQTVMLSFAKLVPLTNSEITHKINVENFISAKSAAIRCHKTQIAIWHQFENMETDFKTYAKWEYFVQKWPKPKNKIVKNNLFEKNY